MTLKSKAKRRDWRDAMEKIWSEPGCRACGSVQNIEAAHTIGREHDPRVEGGGYYVQPDSVIPLCGSLGNDCHGRYDRHELNILPYLTINEQLNAVDAAGGIERARRRLTGERSD